MARIQTILIAISIFTLGFIGFNYFYVETTTFALHDNVQLLTLNKSESTEIIKKVEISKNVDNLEVAENTEKADENYEYSDDIEFSILDVSNNNNISALSTSYRFDDPTIAYLLLQKLDIFENGELNTPKSKTYGHYYIGTKVNPNYCAERQAYFSTHPESVFDEKKNFMTDYWHNYTLRNTIIPNIGRDLHPKIGFGKRWKSSFEMLNPEITIFFTNELMYEYRIVGKHFSCLTQISNHCPGHDNLYKKDQAALALIQYSQRYKARPQCFNTNKFFPETWLMLKVEQCKEFFQKFNNDQYFSLKEQRNIVYIRKIGADVHQGKGVFPVNDEEEAYIRKIYENGTKCGKVSENNIIQHFIHNPLLLENHKFHFRVFMYIASANPFIVYYHDGYLRISFQEYDTTSTERGTFVTNLGMTTILFQDEVGVGDKTNDDIKKDSYWLFSHFHKYLTEQGLVTDPNWVDNHLRSEMKKAMIHIIRMSQSGFWKKSSVSELYGVDFMMDDKLNLWFIEGNSRPLLKGWDNTTMEFFEKMLLDVFEISFGLLRSRTKRIINYINRLIRDKNAWVLEKEDFDLINQEERRLEFKMLTMNWFEQEFAPSPNNGFYLIIDENLKGTEKYMGLIEKECL